MLLGRVVGNVWGARQAPKLEGQRLLTVRPVRRDLAGCGLVERGDAVVALDRLGAGPGELVLVAHSSRARDLTVGDDLPTKAVVLAIVDAVDLCGRGGAR
ncbi:MAG: EutN/CcmL family microcompartment protein [Pseudomonadota bacterium]